MQPGPIAAGLTQTQKLIEPLMTGFIPHLMLLLVQCLLMGHVTVMQFHQRLASC